MVHQNECPQRLSLLTRAQYHVLESLLGPPQTVKELRSQLRRSGYRYRTLEVHQLIEHLDRLGLIRTWYVRKVVGYLVLRECRCLLTTQGERAFRSARAFYGDTEASKELETSGRERR